MPMELIRNPDFDFLGKVRICAPLSLAMLIGALALMTVGGMKYGVEFSGGTQLIIKFQGAPSIDKVRSAVGTVDKEAVIQTYDDPAKNQVLVRLAEGGSQGGVEGDLTAQAEHVRRVLASSYAENPVVESSSEIVGPVVGAELRRKAIYLTLFGLLFQLIYIGFRFQGPAWGGAATLAVVHDVIITFGILRVFGYEITLNVIAALLTLVGYSVNDTIVVFDRVRENLKQMRKASFAKILNDALNQTLTRTIITAGTTFLVVLGLFLFGGTVLRGFAFTLLVGIVLGTYSSLYVAIPLVVWFHNWREKRQAA